MSDRDAGGQQPPNYDVEIDADELLADLADIAAEYGEDYEEKRRWWTESPVYDEFHEARFWMLEARGGQRALSHAIAALQPENNCITVGCYREADGTVDVRGFMSWLSEEADAAHERRGSSSPSRQASEAESAYNKALRLLREDYGVGWPRLDDLGGIKEEDRP